MSYVISKREDTMRHFVQTKVAKKLIISFSIFVILLLSQTLFLSCSSAVDVKNLTSFQVKWPEGFDQTCFSAEAIEVIITAHDQDGNIMNWNGFVSIETTNTDVIVNPSSIYLWNGVVQCFISFVNTKTEDEMVMIKLIHENVIMVPDYTVSIKYPIDGVTLIINNDGNGTTEPSGSILVQKGTSCAINAIPNEGFQFLDWNIVSGIGISFRDKNSVNTTATLSNSNASIQANFFPWWELSWSKRKKILITATDSTTLSDYQVLLKIGYDNNMKSDFADIRFVEDNNSTTLSYYIEEKVNGVSADVWVKINEIINVDEIYMYYDNDSASDESDGEKTFIFFDDFEDGESDTNKWTFGVYGLTPAYGESGGKFWVDSGNVNSYCDFWFYSEPLLEDNFAVDILYDIGNLDYKPTLGKSVNLQIKADAIGRITAACYSYTISNTDKDDDLRFHYTPDFPFESHTNTYVYQSNVTLPKDGAFINPVKVQVGLSGSNLFLWRNNINVWSTSSYPGGFNALNPAYIRIYIGPSDSGGGSTAGNIYWVWARKFYTPEPNYTIMNEEISLRDN